METKHDFKDSEQVISLDERLGDRLNQIYNALVGMSVDEARGLLGIVKNQITVFAVVPPRDNDLTFDELFAERFKEPADRGETVNAFIADRCEASAVNTSIRELYDAYRAWGDRTGTLCCKKRAFRAQLEKKFEISYAAGKTWVLGLKLNACPEALEAL